MRNSDEFNKDSEAIIGLSHIEKVALSAYLFNPSLKIEAYKVAKGITNTEKTDDELVSRANSWLGNKGCKAFLRLNRKIVDLQKCVPPSQSDNYLDVKTLDEIKAKMLSELADLKFKTTDTAEILNINKQIIDLQGLKKETTTTQESQVRYYLPLRCEICDYFNKSHSK